MMEATMKSTRATAINYRSAKIDRIRYGWTKVKNTYKLAKFCGVLVLLKYPCRWHNSIWSWYYCSRIPKPIYLWIGIDVEVCSMFTFVLQLNLGCSLLVWVINYTNLNSSRERCSKVWTFSCSVVNEIPIASRIQLFMTLR